MTASTDKHQCNLTTTSPVSFSSPRLLSNQPADELLPRPGLRAGALLESLALVALLLLDGQVAIFGVALHLLVRQHLVQDALLALLAREASRLGVREAPHHSAHVKHFAGLVGVLVESTNTKSNTDVMMMMI